MKITKKTVLGLPKRHICKVAGFSDDHIGGRLMSMGILPGMPLIVVRIAPLSGGYYLRVNGQNIALRKKEAASIEVA